MTIFSKYGTRKMNIVLNYWLHLQYIYILDIFMKFILSAKQILNSIAYLACVYVWNQGKKKLKSCWKCPMLIKISSAFFFLTAHDRPVVISTNINSLWASNTIWRRGSWSTLAQEMVCCLTAPKPTPEPMLTYHHWSVAAFTSQQFDRTCSRYQFTKPACKITATYSK